LWNGGQQRKKGSLIAFALLESAFWYAEGVWNEFIHRLLWHYFDIKGTGVTIETDLSKLRAF